MKAFLKNARISPKKMNLVAGMVRGKNVKVALDQLKFTPKKAAQILAKLITSAAANATNNFDLQMENLIIKEIRANKGMTYKRGMPVSRGRQHPILKRNTNLSVEVGIAGMTEAPQPVKKGTKKVNTAATETSESEPAQKKTPAKKSRPKNLKS
jgi:large subunit ribosomal protein L22